jgi:hypothetical protein
MSRHVHTVQVLRISDHNTPGGHYNDLCLWPGGHYNDLCLWPGGHYNDMCLWPGVHYNDLCLWPAWHYNDLYLREAACPSSLAVIPLRERSLDLIWTSAIIWSIVLWSVKFTGMHLDNWSSVLSFIRPYYPVLYKCCAFSGSKCKVCCISAMIIGHWLRWTVYALNINIWSIKLFQYVFRLCWKIILKKLLI